MAGRSNNDADPAPKSFLTSNGASADSYANISSSHKDKVSGKFSGHDKDKPRKIYVIGEECDRKGITREILEGNGVCAVENITEMVVAELEIYRAKEGIEWKRVCNWIDNLYGEQNILQQSLRTSFQSMKAKRDKAKRNHNDACIEQMKQQKYYLPIKREPSSSGNTTSKLLTPMLKQNKKLKEMLVDKDDALTKAYIECRKTELQLEYIRGQSEKEMKNIQRLQKNLRAKEEILSDRLERYKPRNVDRREERRDSTIQTLTNTLTEMKDKLVLAERKNEQLKLKTEQLRASRHYFKSKELTKRTEMSTDITRARENEKIFEAKVTSMNSVIENLEEQVKEGRQLHLKDLDSATGQYSNDVRFCYMSLSSLGVSAKNMSKVAATVLKTLGKFDIQESDLPAETFCKLIPAEANIVSSIQVATELEQSTYVTQHSDGTSRDGVKVVDFEVTVRDGDTRTSGLLEVHAGDAATQLHAFKFVMNKLAELHVDHTKPDAVEDTFSKQFISKIKNTMGDQAATQKSFNEQLEKFRAEVVPEVVKNWDQLNEETKSEMLSMNHMFCNLHALIGCATYGDSALKLLEEVWRSKYGKLGAENVREFQDRNGQYAWKHGDSATQRLIRTVCDAIAPGGNQQAGVIGHFKTYCSINGIQRCEVKAFRANRFNVLFECAAGVYYHRLHIAAMFNDGYIKASNKLLRAVWADIQSTPLLAGCRALGILYKQLTTPFWSLVENKQVHILDMSAQVQAAYTKLEPWSRDATPLLDSNLPSIFSLPDGKPIQAVRDHVFDALYDSHTDEVNLLTKQALETVCCGLMVVFERRFQDQLHGKYKNNTSEQRRTELKHTEKSNRRGENDFGYWSYLKQVKPSIGMFSAEGATMYKCNNTSAWLDALSINEPTEFQRVLNQARRERKKWEVKYKQWQEENDQKKEERMKIQAQEYEIQQQRKLQQQADRLKLIQNHGGPCRTADDVDKFCQSLKTKTNQIKGLRAHLVYTRAKCTANADYAAHLFKFSKSGINLSVDELKENLKTVLADDGKTYDRKAENDNENDAADSEDVQDMIDRIKAQYAKHVVEARQSQQSRNTTSKGLSKTERKTNDTDNDDSHDDDDEEEEEEEEEEEDSSMEYGSDSDSSHESCEPKIKKMRVSLTGQLTVNTGEMVAVAFDNSWYVGQVRNTKDNTVTVNYMERCQSQTNHFIWPRKDDVADTDVKFVLCRDVEVVPGNNLRYFCVTDIERIEKAYNRYWNKYFALSNKQLQKKK
ncbi:uncharacterized protein [Ptychodera flava]|uniref:uncharacterized protein n=1 Tax=Ptychodera flava TaxID=63121 RepID=UPI00396A0D44